MDNNWEISYFPDWWRLSFFSNTDSLGYQSFKGASWALVLGVHLGDTIKGLLLILGPFLIPMFRLASGPARILFQTPSVASPAFD